MSPLTRALRRLMTVPFATMIAIALIVISGMGLLGYPISVIPLRDIVGDWAIVLNGTFFVAGIVVLVGTGTGEARVEAPGLVLMATSAIIRASTTAYFVHNMRVFGVVVLYIAIACACVIRVKGLLSGDTLARYR